MLGKKQKKRKTHQKNTQQKPNPEEPAVLTFPRGLSLPQTTPWRMPVQTFIGPHRELDCETYLAENSFRKNKTKPPSEHQIKTSNKICSLYSCLCKCKATQHGTEPLLAAAPADKVWHVLWTVSSLPGQNFQL